VLDYWSQVTRVWLRSCRQSHQDDDLGLCRSISCWLYHEQNVNGISKKSSPLLGVTKSVGSSEWGGMNSDITQWKLWLL
jgi:hypothetical protein